MAIPDRRHRESLMTRQKDGRTLLERGAEPPEHALEVIGIDISEEMIKHAKEQRAEALTSSSQLTEDDIIWLTFKVGDMHSLKDSPGIFDGIWSCTALFTHTPRQFNKQAMENVAQLLKPGGIFFASYTNGDATGGYDKLKLSSTGLIKYFSQPSPGAIGQLARSYGLEEIYRTCNDMKGRDGEVLVKDLFVSQYFKKV